MYFAVLSALLCISSGATFIENSYATDLSSGLDPLMIPSVIREPPLKRGDKRDSSVYPATSSQLSDRVPLREPPLKRADIDEYDENDEPIVARVPVFSDFFWSRRAAPEYRIVVSRPSKRLAADDDDGLRFRVLRQMARLWN
ncbi:unnamed protein product [Nippostrongylus brasiliensis]|uniref:Seminal fluid protein HACP016 n=1 Tax=Nippostrongylus brasiliensis TaxID=27835 RepID=A0A158QYB1_NIPBR|nr:unnamed protein product [Nippostrongylus brasiliensis]